MAGSPCARNWWADRNQFQQRRPLWRRDCSGYTTTNLCLSARSLKRVPAAKSSPFWVHPCSASSNGTLVVCAAPAGRTPDTTWNPQHCHESVKADDIAQVVVARPAWPEPAAAVDRFDGHPVTLMQGGPAAADLGDGPGELVAEDDRHGLAGERVRSCLLYTSDAADEEDSVDLGG